MKVNLIKCKEITEFEKEIGHELVVNERPLNMNLSRFYVSFEHGEVMENGCLVGVFGNGNTIAEAVDDYCVKISGKEMAFNAYTKDRINIICPNLKYTPE